MNVLVRDKTKPCLNLEERDIAGSQVIDYGSVGSSARNIAYFLATYLGLSMIVSKESKQAAEDARTKSGHIQELQEGWFQFMPSPMLVGLQDRMGGGVVKDPEP